MSEISSPPPLEDLEFRGGPADDVTRFLAAIKGAAVIQGRHLDDEWVVSYTESCLGGDAMAWFDDLGSEVTTDWRSLRKALLHRFHKPDSSTAQSPVAAAPPTTVSPQPAETIPMSRCRVRVVKENGVMMGYIATPLRDGWTPWRHLLRRLLS
ncbi:hypothetical protein FRB95_013424 [Tulasnella sp. JGI-2019a]|nr:hypothetical protein FRB95_013424 [Tulasnella sp. JGI-2019a]